MPVPVPLYFSSYSYLVRWVSLTVHHLHHQLTRALCVGLILLMAWPASVQLALAAPPISPNATPLNAVSPRFDGEAQAAITVSIFSDEFNSSGSGAGCSLREAIRSANQDTAFGGCSAGSGTDTIVLSSGTYTLSITGAGEDATATGDLDITSTVTIAGNGPTLTFVDAAPGGATLGDRVVHVLAGASATLSGLTIKNGLVTGDGGGIYNLGTLSLISATVSNNTATGGLAILNRDGGGVRNDGTLLMENSTVVSNTARNRGGGLFNTGTVTLTKSVLNNNTASNDPGGGIFTNDGLINIYNTTLSTNASASHGGGLYATSTALVYLFNTTVVSNTADSDNSAGGDGGGIYKSISSTVSLSNTLMALNIDLGGQAPDCSGTVSSTGYNLLGNNTGCTFSSTSGDQVGTGGSPINPVIGPLGNNGGPTQTHALLTGSPAIDTASSSGCQATDQRGVARPRDGDGNGSSICDIGAYEK